MQIFFRPKNKTVEDSFKRIKQYTTDELLGFYKKNISISNYDLPEGTIAKYHADIIEF